MLLDVLNGQKTTVSKIKQAKDAVQFGHVHFDVWVRIVRECAFHLPKKK